MKTSTLNTTIRTLIISDFFIFFALGLLTPIFAVFIIEHIENRIEVIGYAVSIYWITRVILVVPFSRFMDKWGGENDEYFFMILGTLVISTVPLFYIISSEPWHIYVLAIFNGIGNAMAVPAWRILFTNNIDRKNVGFGWSMEDVGIGVATASSAAVGAFIAENYGFNTLFLVIFALGSVSATVLLLFFEKKRSFLREILPTIGGNAPLKIDAIK